MRDAAEAAGFDDDVAEVLADAAAAVDATYQVTYAVDAGTVVVTQRPPDRRVETTSEDGTVDLVVTVDGTTHACTDPAGEETWRCEELGVAPAGGSFDADAVEALTESLTADAGAYELVVEEREVAGTGARCVVTRPPAAALCIAESGAILLVERSVGTLRATAYETDVPDDAFELPQ